MPPMMFDDVVVLVLSLVVVVVLVLAAAANCIRLSPLFLSGQSRPVKERRGEFFLIRYPD